MKKKLVSYEKSEAVVPDFNNSDFDLNSKPTQEKPQQEILPIKNEELSDKGGEEERRSIEKKQNRDRERLKKEMTDLLYEIQGEIGEEENNFIIDICNLHTALNENFQRLNSPKEDIIDLITKYQDSFKEVVTNYFEIRVLNAVENEFAKKIKIDDFLQNGITKPLETLKENLITVIETEKTPEQRETFFTRLQSFIIKLARRFFKFFLRDTEKVKVELDGIESEPIMTVVNINSISSIKITPDTNSNKVPETSKKLLSQNENKTKTLYKKNQGLGK
jgi:hypothetical protein